MQQTLRFVKYVYEPLCIIIQYFNMFIQQKLTRTNDPTTKLITFSNVQLNNPKATMNKLAEHFTAVLLIIYLPQVRT
jgi:hypothetical protein